MLLLLTSVAARMAALAPADHDGQGPPGLGQPPNAPRTEVDGPGRWVPLFGTTELLRHIRSGRQRGKGRRACRCLLRLRSPSRLDLHQGWDGRRAPLSPDPLHHRGQPGRPAAATSTAAVNKLDIQGHGCQRCSLSSVIRRRFQKAASELRGLPEPETYRCGSSTTLALAAAVLCCAGPNLPSARCTYPLAQDQQLFPDDFHFPLKLLRSVCNLKPQQQLGSPRIE